MKAFILGVCAIALVSAGAWYTLEYVIGDSSAEARVSNSVRLGEAATPSEFDPTDTN